MGYVVCDWWQTGSLAVEATLAEAGVAHDFGPFSRQTDANKASEQTAINPRQQLPALVLPDGTVVTEGPVILSHVILSHVADPHPVAGLSPPPGSSARAKHNR